MMLPLGTVETLGLLMIPMNADEACLNTLFAGLVVCIWVRGISALIALALR
jgi:hypothetical protein